MATSSKNPQTQPAFTSVSGTVVSGTTAPIGEIVTPEQIDAVIKKKEVASGALQLSQSALDLIKQLKAEGSKTAIDVVDQVLLYMTEMAPGKIMPEDHGARFQVALYRALQTGINMTDTGFELMFATILKLVHEHADGVFSPRYFLRFTGLVKLSEDDRQGFVRIVNLLTTTAPVQGRKEALRHVDLPRSLQYGFSELGKRRVMSFFGK